MTRESPSIALTEYWLGRTRAALGDSGSAANNLRVAALYPQYFYGQLARQVFDEQPTLVLPSEAPSPTDIQRFLANDAVPAIAVARAVELDQVTSQFFLALARQLKNPGEIVLLAELAKTTGKPKIALTLAKIAFNRDMPVGEYALPLGVLPEFKTLLDEHVDPAFLGSQAAFHYSSCKTSIEVGRASLRCQRQKTCRRDPTKSKSAAWNLKMRRTSALGH
jgi:soluble lytic murein transglycosylase